MFSSIAFSSSISIFFSYCYLFNLKIVKKETNGKSQARLKVKKSEVMDGKKEIQNGKKITNLQLFC
jgi:hypothetical protein